MENVGFVAAKDLKAGDEVRLATGDPAEVETSERIALAEPIQVYNFEVEDFHTYYVSGQKVLVHNTCAVTTKNVAGSSASSVKEKIVESTKKPYSSSRPSFRKGVVETVWETAKKEDGLVRDFNTGEVIQWTPGTSRKGIWDMGHIPKEKYSEVHAEYMRGDMTKKEFVDWYNNPKNYTPEIPKNNRSHKYE